MTPDETMEGGIFSPKKPIRRRHPSLLPQRRSTTPGRDNLKMHPDRMNEDQIEEVIQAMKKNLDAITVVDGNGEAENKNQNILSKKLNQVRCRPIFQMKDRQKKNEKKKPKKLFQKSGNALIVIGNTIPKINWLLTDQ